MRRKLLAIAALLMLLLAGAVAALVLQLRDRPSAGLDTELDDVTVVQGTATEDERPRKPKRKRGRYRFLPHDELCWRTFGRDPQRSLALERVHLGRPKRHFWVRGLKSYIEYPP